MDNAIKDAMDRICARAEELGRREWMLKPQNMHEHTVATDGISLLVTSGAHGLPMPPELPAKCIADWLARNGDNRHHAELADLLSWLGDETICDKCKGKREVTCYQCNGRKSVEHDCDCDKCSYYGDEPCGHCDETGTLPCSCTQEARDEERCRFFGRYFDRAVLRRCLPRMTGPLTIDAFNEKSEQVLIRHADWTLIVMPMREPDQAVMVPEFPIAEAAQ
jgi:hypothetical protein